MRKQLNYDNMEASKPILSDEEIKKQKDFIYSENTNEHHNARVGFFRGTTWARNIYQSHIEQLQKEIAELKEEIRVLNKYID